MTTATATGRSPHMHSTITVCSMHSARRDEFAAHIVAKFLGFRRQPTVQAHRTHVEVTVPVGPFTARLMALAAAEAVGYDRTDLSVTS